MKLHLLLFAFLNAFNLFAQTLTLKQEKVVRNLISHHFHDNIANHTSLNQGANSFIFNGNDTLYSLQGFHYLFKINGDTLERLDHSIFHGGNFDRFLYTYDGKVHLMGGYGLFNTNNNVEVFDFKNKEWGVIKTSGYKPEFIRGMCLRVDDFIYSFFNTKNGNNVEDDTYDSYIYRLNLNTNEWDRFENINLPVLTVFHRLYTLDFCIGILLNSVIIINKNTAEFIYIPREELRLNLDMLFNYTVSKNNISFKNYLSTPDLTKYSIDVDSLWEKHKNNVHAFILEPAWYQSQKVQLFFIIGSVLLIMCLVLFYFIKIKVRRRIQISKNIMAVESTNPIAEKLLSANKTTFDIDELDTLLEISHMEFDSRKLKRHRLLSDLEKTNPGLIQRQKDETDKRRFIYSIHKIVG